MAVNLNLKLETNLSSKHEENVKVLPYDLPYMPDEFRLRAELELFENEETRILSLKLLRSMLKDGNIEYLDEDQFLLTFLRARKFNAKRTYTLMKTFYSVRKKHAELYNSGFHEITRTLEENSVGFLPFRDEEGCCILVIKFERWNPLQNSFGDIARALTAALLHAIHYPASQVAGFKAICDMKGLSLGKLPHITPSYLWLLTEALQNCFPARFRAIHIVNENHLFTFIWKIVRKFMTEKLKSRFHFHGKNVDKLHKYFSPSILPAEFNGMLPTFDNTDWASKVIQTSEYIIKVLLLDEGGSAATRTVMS